MSRRRAQNPNPPEAEGGADEAASPRSLAEAKQAHADALARLAELKRQEPRPLDEVHQQKLHIQALADEVAGLEAADLQ